MVYYNFNYKTQKHIKNPVHTFIKQRKYTGMLTGLSSLTVLVPSTVCNNYLLFLNKLWD